MEFLIEFIGELAVELLTEVIKNNKITLWIRIPFIFLFSIGVLGIIGLIMYLGLKFINNNILASLILLIISLIFLVFYIIFMYKLLKNKDV
ncbi:MAG: hypothetical protein E7163_05740 [Firmicutes bacterium]|nr:hypothetical protein [Bacillota bacterium]